MRLCMSVKCDNALVPGLLTAWMACVVTELLKRVMRTQWCAILWGNDQTNVREDGYPISLSTYDRRRLQRHHLNKAPKHHRGKELPCVLLHYGPLMQPVQPINQHLQPLATYTPTQQHRSLHPYPSSTTPPPACSATLTVTEILPFSSPPARISHSNPHPPYRHTSASNARILSSASSRSIATAPAVVAATGMGINTMTTWPSFLPLKLLRCTQACSTGSCAWYVFHSQRIISSQACRRDCWPSRPESEGWVSSKRRRRCGEGGPGMA